MIWLHVGERGGRDRVRLILNFKGMLCPAKTLKMKENGLRKKGWMNELFAFPYQRKPKKKFGGGMVSEHPFT